MKTSRLDFFVPGIPAPGGSKRGFVNPRNNRVIVTEDNKRSKPWRQSVEAAANDAMLKAKLAPFRGAVQLAITFVFPRPQTHYRTGKHSNELRQDAPLEHLKRPDVTKLIRSTEDALKGIAWVDDCQVYRQTGEKYYGDRPGAHVAIVGTLPA